MVVPVRVVLHARSRLLEIEWPDGVSGRLPHALLRERCRCAQCVRALRDGLFLPIAASVSVQEVKPLADHGLNLVFSDGHERGIYPWAYLRELCLSGAEAPAASVV